MEWSVASSAYFSSNCGIQTLLIMYLSVISHFYKFAKNKVVFKGLSELEGIGTWSDLKCTNQIAEGMERQ